MSQQERNRKPVLRTTWDSGKIPYDKKAAGQDRFYKLETLANATDRMVRGHDRFIAPSVQGVLGPAALTSLAFQLHREETYKLVFRLRAANTRRKRGVFAYVVAKNHREYSALVEAEFGHLCALHRRAPAWVVQPHRGGAVFLPDRHRHTRHGREVYAYVTPWLSGYTELGIHKNGQFLLEGERPHTLKKAETEHVKRLIIELVLRTYDMGALRAINLRDMVPGDLMIKQIPRGDFKLRLVSCRQLRARVPPDRLIHQILTASWPSAQEPLELAPAAPEDLVDALAKAAGGDTARQWLIHYVATAARGSLRSCAPSYLEALRRLVVK